MTQIASSVTIVHMATIDRSDLEQYLRHQWAPECGKRVQKRRKLLGLTLAQVADVSGMTAPSLSRIETGRQDPADSTKFILANVLGCGVEDLWPWPDMSRVLAVSGEYAA